MSDASANLKEIYASLLESGQVKADMAQKDLVNKLYQLQTEIELKLLASESNFFEKLFASRKESLIRGLYIYGDVGRGKSMVMDLFFESLHIKKKQRIHFHAFMVRVHDMIHQWRQDHKDNGAKKDPIPDVADQIALDTKILCFDEFQVTDIADATILGRLFTALFERSVVMVATSNVRPCDLYKDGLQREHFMPFLEVLAAHVDEFALRSNEDYRLSHLKALNHVYHAPLGRGASEFAKLSFNDLTNHADSYQQELRVKGRRLVFDTTHGDICWTDFYHLCEAALGAEDYIEIARNFSTIIIEDIPVFTSELNNECKRFIHLIDALYEHHTKLICTADAPLASLFESGSHSFSFKRTVSRLTEMQSESYLSLPHLG